MRLLEVDGTAPEEVVVDGAGRVVTGVADGRLLVCDARRGLLAEDVAAYSTRQTQT